MTLEKKLVKEVSALTAGLVFSGHVIPTATRFIWRGLERNNEDNPFVRMQALMIPTMSLAVSTIGYGAIEYSITDSQSKYLWAIPLVTSALSGIYEIFRHYRSKKNGTNK